jgi:hypothetical protein
MLGVDHALAEVIEVLGDRQVAEDRANRRTGALTEPADDPQQQEDDEAAVPATIWLLVSVEMNNPWRRIRPEQNQSEITGQDHLPGRVAQMNRTLM